MNVLGVVLNQEKLSLKDQLLCTLGLSESGVTYKIDNYYPLLF